MALLFIIFTHRVLMFRHLNYQIKPAKKSLKKQILNCKNGERFLALSEKLSYFAKVFSFKSLFVSSLTFGIVFAFCSSGFLII
jgi:hypothetical protein